MDAGSSSATSTNKPMPMFASTSNHDKTQLNELRMTLEEVIVKLHDNLEMPKTVTTIWSDEKWSRWVGCKTGCLCIINQVVCEYAPSIQVCATWEWTNQSVGVCISWRELTGQVGISSILKRRISSGSFSIQKTLDIEILKTKSRWAFMNGNKRLTLSLFRRIKT